MMHSHHGVHTHSVSVEVAQDSGVICVHQCSCVFWLQTTRIIKMTCHFVNQLRILRFSKSFSWDREPSCCHSSIGSQLTHVRRS